jgi:signal transduction histidine kinase
VRPSEPGESAIRLPWLAPGTASLVALARTTSPAVWPTIRTDPGAVLLLARHLPADAATLPDSLFRSADVLQTALPLVGECAAIDWSSPDCGPVHEAAVAIATLAEALARRAGGCEPACAWTAGLLAPLGWLAVCAVDSGAAGECLREPVYTSEFADVQRELWRHDAAAVARRLARRWKLPAWLRAVAGHLAADADLAISLGADERLFRVAQLAVLLARDHGHDLGLAVGGERGELAAALDLSDDDLDAIVAEWRDTAHPALSRRSPDPALLPDLLMVAIEKRRLDDGPHGERVEEEVDRLHDALAARRASEAARLHVQKLRALAEFAAGAGHEINNPLAVISGHAQRLLRTEMEDDQQASLRGIVKQTERIHQVLMDLMQFSRPPQPRRIDLDLRQVIDEASLRLRSFAEERGVRLILPECAERLTVHVDAAMLRTAIGCLLRNAAEAAPRDGWVRVSINAEAGRIAVVVEDSGPGPAAARREHLFDPFYSGRPAGRGRGLGLPTAWRLARENGGDVRFEPTTQSPARFVLTLPVCPRGTTPLDPAHNELRKTA